MMKTGRNEPCPCGSGKKYKQCCMQFEGAATSMELSFRQPLQAAAGHREAGSLPHSSDPDHYYNLANTLRDQGRPSEAVACYRTAISIKPDHVIARNNLGTVLQSQGKPEEAIDCYRKALAFKPDDAGSHNNLGNVLNEVGLVDAAVASYRRALELREAPEFKTNFALCVRSMDSVEV